MLTAWLQSRGLPESDCFKYYDTLGGGRGCRFADGMCDGFIDEEYTPCDASQGLPESDCFKYYDTLGGGRGCRFADGMCDGFIDEDYTPCDASQRASWT
ncbi:hypothetical protein EMIHUDRAFT_255629 [Emiliania huxleyi CCMP1516]|uniref:Uncharacterized protein n=2 Tax=Emiliania huxleyi TaxID=2903 RepID=A0A0D3J7Z7_EMIH1|nr:hypothetical protein EMIHUDRAFT_255629 [Emiliania huxleyi CCMP1516]EOD19632.1 hypothetical protein EMIHUDRAFT_255629 [Emiliania huxleyi CCMP1516]|eukprot:XP_005772061.1 hypothetical protein EMIHUDRAFT_255629 [Emiliania huxleyi CCMP1516]